MKFLKVEDYIKLLAVPKGADVLYRELEDYVNNGPGLECKVLCDRVIRACNHQLGAEELDADHLANLVSLVQLALRSYEGVCEPASQGSPLYMEKILFHIIKKLAARGAQQPCQQLGGLLYRRLVSLSTATEIEDYQVLVRSCFAVLWIGKAGTQAKLQLPPRDKLSSRIQALSFLVLLGGRSATSPYSSKVLVYAEDALSEFARECGSMSEADTSFLLQETQGFLLSSLRAEEEGPQQVNWLAPCEVMVQACKVLCRAGLWARAHDLVRWARERLSKPTCAGPFLKLTEQAVDLQRMLGSGKDCAKILAESARTIRSLPGSLGDRERQAFLQVCQLITCAFDTNQNKVLTGTTLLAWFSFLEEHQELLNKHLLEASALQQDQKRFYHHTLCCTMCQGFTGAYNSLAASELDDEETLERVLLYCKATAGQLLHESQKLASDNAFIKAASTISRLAHLLYNRKHFDQAFTLVEILCHELLKKNQPTVPVDKLNQAFLLAVQSSRTGGHLDRALDWVVLWLQTLGDQVTEHMTEPVSLWVKTKADSARGGQADTRLRTLRDGFGAHAPGEETMLCLLEEELRAYREVSGDTAQERYNTLCDLLDICHEESVHTHRRAVYLYEMAQVVCFQDFSEQTDCSAVDFALESLRLLAEEPETTENSARLRDDKAQASLWLYTCTLEKNLHEAMEVNRRLQEAQRDCSLEVVGTNDLDYEDKRKQRDSHLVYEGLRFNLAAANKQCQPLDRSLELWRDILAKDKVPAVRSAKTTVSSIVLMAALYKLIGKPLRALESHQLAAALARQTGNDCSSASSMCHSARLLLEMGAPELAQQQLKQAEQLLPPVDSTSEGLSPLHVLATLLRAQVCYSTGQVEVGVSHLCQVLNKVGEQRYSKTWYLLRAKALQTASAYLSLSTATLPSYLRQRLAEYGLKTPDTTLYEGLKLLCSLVVTLLGNGLYGSNVAVDTRFVDQGDNVLLKWQLLAEVLSCSLSMVAVRSVSGAIHEAKVQCLEALKLATKLQTLSQCAEFLVVKAELELQKGERELSGMDLEQVKNLLDLCTDFTSSKEKVEVKIKPRKGRPAKKASSPKPEEEDYSDLLKTRSFYQQPVDALEEWAQTSSPKLKPRRQSWLTSLGHKADCGCPCCSDPALGRVSARWAIAQAELAARSPEEVTEGLSRKLFLTALSRCNNIVTKVTTQLSKLMPTKDKPSLSFLDDLMGRIYLSMSLSSLELRLQKSTSVWELLDAGLSFVSSKKSPDLEPVCASLQATKALASVLTLAAQRNCSPEELFSSLWAWNPPTKSEHKPKKLPSTKKAKEPASLASKAQEVKKARDQKALLPSQDAKKTKDPAVSKVKMTLPSAKSKTLTCKTPLQTRTSKSGAEGEPCVFDFNDNVPQVVVRPHSPVVPHTPVQPAKLASARRRAAKPVPKLQFQVYEESSSLQEQPRPVPAAPKRSTRSRFKVEFSDESDTESQTPAACGRKARLRSKTVTAKEKTPPASAGVSLKGRGSRSTALHQLCLSSEDELSAPPPRRGRQRRVGVAKGVSNGLEDPEQMRTIKEEECGVNTSMEELAVCDTEEHETSAKSGDLVNTDLEVLRRDLWVDREGDGLGDLKRGGHYGFQLAQTVLPSSAPDGLSLDLVKSLLHSALLSLQHFPPSWLYPRLCGLLALCQGQADPLTTAMFHCQSLGITSRHHMTRHLASRLKKLKKAAAPDLAEKLGSLSLDNPCTQMPLHQRLSQLEAVFTFPTLEPAAFPYQHCQQFRQQLQEIPPGVTVCLLSVVGVQPGEIGDTLLLTRLERDAPPVSVRLPTAQRQSPVSTVVQEMDDVQKQQKVVSSVADKAQWWEGRKLLDSRVEKVLEEMRAMLGCWAGLLLPLSSDPELICQTKSLHGALAKCGARTTDHALKVVLSASPLLSNQDVFSLAVGLCPDCPEESSSHLQASVSALRDRAEPQGHVVLILDKYLQRLPWENISCLKPHSVTRMPSLQFLIGHCVAKELDPECVLNRGVDPQKVFYVLNPDGSLKDSEERFREWFSNELGWQGVCAMAPDPLQLQEAVSTKDLYIYVGHGAGARFIDGQRLLREDMRAASLLIGCSSAALAVNGDLEGSGIILNYLMAGCPLVLGNLWDVTDRDIDRFTKALLQSWLSAGRGAALLDHMASSRQATFLKHLIGAAPVVYGLPVFLR